MIPNANRPDFKAHTREVHFRISPELLAIVDDMSCALGVQRAQFIKNALFYYMGAVQCVFFPGVTNCNWRFNNGMDSK